MKRPIFATLLIVMAGTLYADEPYKEWNKFLAGTWTFPDSDATLKMDLTAKGVAVQGTGKDADGVESAWLYGWDPAQELYIHQWFGKKHGRAAYKIIDDTTLEGQGVIHGPEEITKGNVEITREGDDTYVVKWSNVKQNGKKAHDMVFTAKRR